jgi:hypothetical protein
MMTRPPEDDAAEQAADDVRRLLAGLPQRLAEHSQPNPSGDDPEPEITVLPAIELTKDDQ